MSENYKNSGILNKIKALVAKTGKSITWRNRSKDNDISEKIAQKIQKNSYDLSLIKRKDTFSPPYLSLAEQMQVEDEQIFNAAVYNMACIAKSRRQYRADILAIFNKYLESDKLRESKKEYIRRKISEI